MMDANAWLGLGLGLIVGAAYGAWQRRAMGAGPKPDAVGGAFGGAILRLTVLLVLVYLLVRFTPAHRVWLVGGVMAGYGILFGIMMLKVIRQKK